MCGLLRLGWEKQGGLCASNISAAEDDCEDVWLPYCNLIMSAWVRRGKEVSICLQMDAGSEGSKNSDVLSFWQFPNYRRFSSFPDSLGVVWPWILFLKVQLS